MIRARDPLADPEELIRRVYAYVAYRIGDGPDAEDVTSETFERALRYRERYDRSKGEPVAWVLGIARRCIADHYEQRPAPTGAQPDVAGPRDLADDAVQRLVLRDAVAGLEERDRELIALRYGADLTARQIAELLDCSVNAAEVALHRALGRARAALDGDAAAGKRLARLAPAGTRGVG